MRFVAVGAILGDTEYVKIYTEESYKTTTDPIAVISVTSCEHPANLTLEAALCNAVERFINGADFELELKK